MKTENFPSWLITPTEKQFSPVSYNSLFSEIRDYFFNMTKHEIYFSNIPEKDAITFIDKQLNNEWISEMIGYIKARFIDKGKMLSGFGMWGGHANLFIWLKIVLYQKLKKQLGKNPTKKQFKDFIKDNSYLNN